MSDKVLNGWRVMMCTSSVQREGDRWEVYSPEGSGGVVSTHDVRDWAVRGLLDALAEKGGACVAQSAPAGEREAAIEAAYAAVVEGGWSSVKELGIEMFQAGAAWQRTQAAGVPDAWRDLLRRARRFVEDWDDDSQEFMDLCGEIDNALAAAPAQPEKVAHSAQWPTTPGLSARPSEVQRLRKALEWYAEKAKQCRKIGADGDNARQALDLDGGFRALEALAASTGQEVK